MTKLPLTGGCSCGAVRYEISSEPGFSFLCQCRDCQQATGTGHAPSFIVDKKDWAVSGKLTSHDVDSDSGGRTTRQFCPTCGSPISGVTSKYPDNLMIFAASLDDPSVFHPQKVIFTDSAQPWDYVDPKLV